MASETSVIRVPIRVDGLYLEGPRRLGLPMADFSRLPYHLSNGSTINPGTPNLAEVAFNARLGRADGVDGNGLVFPKGLHLHWALPDALTTGHHRGGPTQFPAVPNRWLVRRLDSSAKLQKSWIVESDFLHPCDKNGDPTHQPSAAWPEGKPITFPTKRFQLTNKKPGAAFRYMGRNLSLADWLKEKPSGDYLNQVAHSKYQLTALGYGEPTFAAYYPNCYSVFGFCDVEPDANTSYEYQVIGWFNEAALDPLQSDFSALRDDAHRYAALEKEYGWSLAAADKKKAFPTRTVCYASLTLTPRLATPWQPAGKVDIAIGNTGGEALSALLADKVAAQPSDKKTIEDQLEAMNLAPALQGVEVDYPAHFAQTRHQRGFRGIAGGNRWVVLPIPVHRVSASDANPAAQPPLPDAVAHALDRLNAAQEAYDRAQQEIVELRYQVFCDWHKFHVAYYSSATGLEPFKHQSDDLARFIESQGLASLNEKVTLAGSLDVAKDVVRKDTAERVVVLARADAHGSNPATLDLRTHAFSSGQARTTTLALQVVLRLKALLDALIAAKLTVQFEINTRPAEHFWRPREPVVLLAGDVAVSTPRHGEDGNLACAVLAMPDAPGAGAFIDKVATLKPAGGDPAVQTQSSPPWHPIILEWSVAVQTASITTSFKLHDSEPDLAPTEDAPVLDRLMLTLGAPGSNSYEGRCVMTPTAGTQLDANLRIFLTRATLDDCRDRSTRGTSEEREYLDRLIAWHFTKHHVPAPTEDDKKGPWLKQQKPFIDAKQEKDEHGNPRLLPVADLCAWYADKPVAGGANSTVSKTWNASQQASDPIYSAIRALSCLGSDRQAGNQRMNVLSQALGGFNAALMTRKQVLQIPIEDPLGATEDLTTRVAKAVGHHHPLAPLSDKVFSPVRSGRFSLGTLRLVDTFGQQWNAPLAGARLVTSNGLGDPQDPAATYLPPRFVPAARLNFRWLAALSGEPGADEVEMNSAPATTPICGWLLPNHFDNSLMVYDNTGRALGSINTLAEWMPAPGASERIAAAQVPNPHLRRLVRRLVLDVGRPAREATIRQRFLRSFLSTLDRALEAIEPASFAQHEALALLMGRPIAVVRTRVDLQLLGHPMQAERIDDPTIAGGQALRLKKSRRWSAFVDQDWDVFAADWGRFYGCSLDDVMNESCTFLDAPPAGYARTTGGFEKIVIPIRLGEHQLLNDGLVGFWKETAAGELDNVFHAPQTLDDLDMPAGVTYQEGRATPCLRGYASGAGNNLSLALRDEPLTLTMLMDPRGVVHATSGVLPVGKLEIPSAYYAGVLKRMKVTFRVSPLLTDSEQLHAAVPKEPGYVWSWVTKPDGSSWAETKEIVDATEHADFFSTPKIAEGWLKLTPKDNG